MSILKKAIASEIEAKWSKTDSTSSVEQLIKNEINSLVRVEIADFKKRAITNTIQTHEDLDCVESNKVSPGIKFKTPLAECKIEFMDVENSMYRTNSVIINGNKEWWYADIPFGSIKAWVEKINIAHKIAQEISRKVNIKTLVPKIDYVLMKYSTNMEHTNSMISISSNKFEYSSNSLAKQDCFEIDISNPNYIDNLINQIIRHEANLRLMLKLRNSITDPGKAWEEVLKETTKEIMRK